MGGYAIDFNKLIGFLGPGLATTIVGEMAAGKVTESEEKVARKLVKTNIKMLGERIGGEILGEVIGVIEGEIVGRIMGVVEAGKLGGEIGRTVGKVERQIAASIEILVLAKEILSTFGRPIYLKYTYLKELSIETGETEEINNNIINGILTIKKDINNSEDNTEEGIRVNITYKADGIEETEIKGYNEETKQMDKPIYLSQEVMDGLFNIKGNKTKKEIKLNFNYLINKPLFIKKDTKINNTKDILVIGENSRVKIETNTEFNLSSINQKFYLCYDRS